MSTLPAKAFRIVEKKPAKITLGVILALSLIAAIAVPLYLIYTSRSQANAYLDGFDPGNIMSDFVMGNKNTMTESQINDFLHSKNPCNRAYDNEVKHYESLGYQYSIKDNHVLCMADDTFNDESAAHIIWQAAQDYSINPQVLIVLLEKEQSLVTDTWPNHRQYAKATGFACPDTGGCDAKDAGFKNQIRKAAALFREVLDGGWSNYPAYTTQFIYYNPSASCGGSNVYIQNRATSALYRYTPYQPNSAALVAGTGTGDSCSSYGNRNFYNLFTDWFGDTRVSVDTNIYIPDGTYRLKSNTGHNLDIAGVGKADGTNVWLWEQNYAGGQVWEVKRLNDGFYTLRNPNSGKYLDVAGGGTIDGTDVRIWSGNTACAQKWAITTNGDGYRLQSACSGKSLDIAGGNMTNGTDVRIWSSNSASAQRWYFESLDSPVIEAGRYRVKTSNGKNLDIAGVGTVNGTNVWLWEQNNAGGQVWDIERTNDGLYTLTNPHSGKKLDVSGSGTANGTNVQIWQTIQTSCAQKWAIEENGDGYRLISSCSSKSLDIDAGNLSNGVNVQIWDNNDSQAQRWYLEKANDNIIPDGTYRLKSNTGHNLDIAGVGKADGTNVWLWEQNYAGGQVWEVKRLNDGFYTLRNPNSGKYLDVAGGGTIDGTDVRIWSGNTACAQKWAITTNGDGYRLQSACSGKSLDIAGGNMTNGTDVRIWSSNSASAQRWYFESLDSPVIEAGRYRVKTSNGKNLDIAGVGTVNGTNVWLWEQNNAGGQVWDIERTNDGLYTLTNPHSGKKLDVSGSGTANGTNVQIWQTIQTSCAQKWAIEENGDGYRLISSCSSKSLDIDAGNLSNGVNVQIWDNNDSQAQRWYLEKANT